VDAPGQLTEPVDDIFESRSNLAEVSVQTPQPDREHRVQFLQLQTECDEMLLGAVVEVPLDAPASFVSRGDDPRPGGAEHGAALSVGDRHGHQLREVARRVSVLEGKCWSPLEPMPIIPHRRPSTVIGAPTADRRLPWWAVAPSGPEASA